MREAIVHSQRQPAASSRTGRLVAGTPPPRDPTKPSPSREVFGFANAGSLGDPNVGYQSWQFGRLSTVAFFGLTINGDGTIAHDNNWTTWNSATNANFIATAHANGTRVVLSMVLQDFATGMTMCQGLTKAATTISQVGPELQAKGVDGVNVDYESTNVSCGPDMSRGRMTTFMQQLRAGLRGYLSIDTYASSAGDSAGFFDIPGIAPSVDAFFAMSYDLDRSNSSSAGCGAQYCLSPVSPTFGYLYNDNRTAHEYSLAVPASKVILGLPYYGRKACVASAAPNQVPVSNLSTPTYELAATASTTTGVSNFVTHVDPHDSTEEYDTFHNATIPCDREQYWENASSMGSKYALVSSYNLRGAGLFALDYGGPAPELWRQLAAYFGGRGGGALPAPSATPPTHR